MGRPRLVFVHGIGGYRSVTQERDRWLRTLAEGAHRAGHSRLAAGLASGDLIATEFAYYRELFDKPQAQGPGDFDLDEEQANLLTDLLAELVAAQLAENPAPQVHDVLLHAQAQLTPEGQPQGLGDILRRTISVATTLLGIGSLRRGGQWASGKLMVRELAQVVRYLTRREADRSGSTLDQRIRARVHSALGDGPAVVVAHSLGSVVALEALHEYGGEVPLLVTIGSPIGMRMVVWPRIVPQPTSTPEVVGRWLNFWDRDDIFAVRPQLTGVAPNRVGVRPDSARVDSDGLWVHSATKYLAAAAVAGPVAEVIGGLVRSAAE